MKQDQTKKQFIDLYNSLSDRLFRYCLVRVSNREQAVDIVQDTFLRFWDVLSSGESEIKNARAFLYTIATNLIIDWYRKKKSISLDVLLLPDEEGGAGLQFADDSYRHIEIGSEAKLVIQKISSLDPIYQQVVYLRFVDDLPPKEIAEILKLDANVVSVRINRGIKELQKLVIEDEKNKIS
ncbi:MAG: RNA polymerase sigma factor [Patescibacteria group bacterium]